MYICYVDESGHCGKKLDPNQPVEVVCGVITDVTKLFKTQREHAALLTDLGIAELKSAHAYAGRKEWGAVPPEERDSLFDKVLTWADERKCKYIPCPVDSDRFFEDKKKNGPLSKRLGYPYEAGAMNVLLAVQRHHKGKKKNKGKTVVILDEQQAHDENLLQILAADLSWTDSYTGYKPRPKAKMQELRLDQIIDVPHFSKSHLAVLIQVADLASFIINSYLRLTCYAESEKYVGELAKMKAWFQRIGESRIPHTATDPPGKSMICSYFREEIRPPGWSAKSWMVLP